MSVPFCYNESGIVMMAIPLLIVSLIGVYMPEGTLWMLIGAWGITVLVWDATGRIVRADGRLLDPRKGGHFWFIPVWIWGTGAFACYVNLALERGRWLPF